MSRERRRVGFVYDEIMCAHERSGDKPHVERPDRITSIFTLLENEGIVRRCLRVQARDATSAELESVHDKQYITNIYTLSDAMKSTKSQAASPMHRILKECYDNDIYFNGASYKSALLAAGSVVEIAKSVAIGDLSAGAAVVRPPGHHAEPQKAMGFCLFNNVAIAAKNLLDGNFPVERVLIVDWDVHHGNGTQHIFWKDPNVLYFSIHREDSYPGGANTEYKEGNYDRVGEGDGAGFNINVPWPHKGFGDLDYLYVFDRLLLPVARQFKPDLVLVSAGFDSGKGEYEQMGGCEVTTAGYSQMTKKLMELANGRLVLVLEGGYNSITLSASYLACMKVILGDSPEELGNSPEELKQETVDLVTKIRRVGVLLQKWTALSKDESGAQEVIVISDDDEFSRNSNTRSGSRRAEEAIHHDSERE